MPNPTPIADPRFREQYAQAEHNWYAGEFLSAISILENTQPRTATERIDWALLMSRSLLRVDRFQDVIDILRSADRTTDADREASARMLLGAALLRSDRVSEAEVVLGEAASIRGVHRTIAAEISYERAFVEYKRRDSGPGAIEHSRKYAVEALGKADDIVRARVQQLIGFINTAQLQYVDAARSFREALTTLQSSSQRDVQLEANILHQAAALASERIDVSVLPVAVETANRIAWTTSMHELHFQVAQNIGWLALVAGNTEIAWARFHEALSAAGEDEAYRAMAFTNLATFHRTIGESFSAARYLGDAEVSLSRVNWQKVSMDRRMSLLEWVIEAKRQDRNVPGEMLETYSALPDGTGLKALNRTDPRARALYDTARGLATWREGDASGKGRKILERALKTWGELGFAYRAAALAMDLYHREHDKKYVDIASSFTQDVKTGTLRAQIRETNRKESRGLSDLSTTERRILTQILAGKSAAQIASESNRSISTIKNQTRHIFQILNVSSRVQLFVVCANLGDLPAEE